MEPIYWPTFFFWMFAIVSCAFAVAVVVSPNIVRMAFYLVMSLAGSAGLFFVAGADLRQFAIAGALSGAVFLFLVTTLPHAAARVDSYRIALSDPTQAGWHVQQSVVALATGGLFGVGLGESTQKFGPLPLAHTDGVFAILGEELGLFGCLIAIGLLAMLVWRGIRAAMNARDGYGFLLALGITAWLSFQALINMAVITSVVPFTGIPLPFMSYGGSSLAMSLIGVGILLSISRDASLDIREQPSRPSMRQPTNGRSVRETVDMRRRDRRPHLPRFGGRR